jgi:hypothetical protein
MTTPIKTILLFLLVFFCFNNLLSQTPCVNPPIIKVQPQNKNIIVGEQTLIYVKDSVGQSYQWQINTGGGFTNLSDGNGITGSATSILLFENTTISQDNSQYRCVLTNACGSTISSVSTFSIKLSPKSAISGTNPRYYCTGSNYTLTVPNIAGADYQWLKNPSFKAIDSTLTVRDDFDFTIDKNGVIYLAMGDSYGLSVKKYENNVWQQLGTGNLPFAATGFMFDIQVDNNNVPYITYIDSNISYRATVRKFENSNWVLVGSRAVSSGDVYSSILFFDLLNIPYVAFSDGGNGYRIVVKKFEGTWNSVGTNIISSTSCTSPSLAIDGLNNLYIGYNDFNINKAVVKKMINNSWQTVSATNAMDTSSPLYLKIDKSGYLYLAYTYDYGKMIVKKFTNNSWVNLGDIKILSSYGVSFSLELDNANNVYLYYGSQTRSIALKYINGNWKNIFTPVDVNGQLKIGIDGLPVVVGLYDRFFILKYNGTIVGNNSSSFIANTNDSYELITTTNYSTLSDNFIETQNIIAPSIITQPKNDSVMINSFITFQTKSTQQGDLIYQWQENNVNLSDNQDVSGSNTSSLKLHNILSSQEGKQYKCVVSNICGSDNSTNATILKTFLKPQSVITKMGSNLLCSGEQINMSVSPSIAGAKYEWIKNPSWQASLNIIPNSFTGRDQSLVSDSKGKVYTAYTTIVNNVGIKVNVQVLNNGVWQNVGSPNFATVAGSVSIAIDNNDIPYVLYGEPNSSNSGFTLIKFQNNSWQIVGEANFSLTSDPYGYDKMYLDFDNNNIPYIAFIEESYAGGKAIVIKYENDTWQRVGQTNPSGGNIGDMAFIIDNYGIPYITYQDPTKSFKATTKRLINNIWETLPQFTAFNTGVQDLTLHVDKNNDIYIGYADGEAFITFLVVQKFQNNSWQHIYSIRPGEVFDINSINVDASGSVYVLYTLLSGYTTYLKKIVGNTVYSIDKASISSVPSLRSFLTLDKKGIPFVMLYELSNSINKISVKKFDGLAVGGNTDNYSTSQIGTYTARVINYEGAYATHLVNEDVIYSISSGNWENATTWSGGRIPRATDRVVIDINHTITVSANNNDLKNITMCNNGKLIYSSTTGKIRMK